MRRAADALSKDDSQNMRRILSVLVLAAMGAASASAHGDKTHYTGQDVTVKTTKVAGNVYMLQGRGGNIGALTGSDGILIIDDDFKAVSEKLRDALRELGSEKPRYILNTHWHGDHTEGNFFFGKDATIVAHVNVRKRLLDPPVVFGQKTPAYPSFALPVVTYTESMSLHLNGEEIKLVYYPNGHTDGDSVVFFVNSNVVHMGDDFFTGKFPFVDIDSGGSVQGLINNVASLIRTIPADAKIIPGHGPLGTIDDLKAFHQALVETSNIVQAGMKAGKSIDEIKKSGFPEKYKDWGSGFIKTDMWVDIVHRSFAKK
jgi:glyoxylase-like metal-dependent hydrolase (beta-lactamase superfamily II)